MSTKLSFFARKSTVKFNRTIVSSFLKAVRYFEENEDRLFKGKIVYFAQRSMIYLKINSL